MCRLRTFSVLRFCFPVGLGNNTEPNGPASAKVRQMWGILSAFAQRTAILSALAVFAAGITPVFAQTVRHHQVTETEPDPLASAEAAIAKQDWSTAEAELKRSVEKDSKDYRAWYDLGFVYSQTNRRAEAIEAYRKSVAANPAVFESNYRLGVMLWEQNDPNAEGFLRAATKLKPASNPEASLERAWLALGHDVEEAKPKDALEAFSEAERFEPKDAEPHLSRAIVLERIGNVDQAEAEFRTASELDPQSAEALAGLANVYSKAHRLPEAEAALRKLIALDEQKHITKGGDHQSPDPQKPGMQNNSAQLGAAHIQLGRVLAAEGRSDEAADELQAGLKLGPDPAAQRDAAGVYLLAGKYAEAEAGFRDAIRMDPASADNHYGLGSALMQEKKFAEAQPELMKALQLDPRLAEAYGDLAVVANENKDYALAIRALDARASLLPEIPATYFLRATAYDHLRDWEHAVAYYHRFLDAANGKFPDQEWKARHRLLAIEKK
jgi:tetratricopeptide (TPR) repeat protein